MMSKKKIVFICSPLRGSYTENQNLAKIYCKEAILEGALPIAPHIYFTQFLNDEVEAERNLGVACGISLLDICDEIWVYAERGVSDGMKIEIEHAKQRGIKTVWRKG